MGIFNYLTGFGGRDMAVDLGTANTLVYVRGRGIVLSEPSVVAIDQRTGDVHAVGVEAKRMLGRTPGSISAIRPLKDGVIADFDVTEQMLRHFIQKVHQHRFAHPRVVVCVPSGVTGVEKRAVEEATLSAGARQAYLIEEPMAAAIGAGLPVAEPTVTALNSRSQDVLAMGHEAWQMIGRTPGYIVAVRPLRGGAITDFEITQRLIRMLFQRAGISRLQRARVLICVPSAITHVEQRAVLEAARRAGAAQTFLIEQPMAAAIGAGLPIHEPMGNMVIDVGGGTTEVAVISLGGVVALEALRVGSFDIDSAIQGYVRREYGIAIGERTAEEIKLAIGSAWALDDDFKAEVRGRDLMSGLPKTIVLVPEEVRGAIEEQIRAICDAVIACLARTPPELAQDLIHNGVHLVGGGSLLRGLGHRISNETDLPVHLVDAPLECVVLGAGRCLESFESLKGMFMARSER